MSEYRAYGIDIHSELPCPELLAGGGTPDLAIRIGTVPERLEKTRDQGVCHQGAPHDLLLHIEGIASYRISDGREIVIQPALHGDEGSVRYFLLGAALGVALCQRGLLVLRASVVEVGGEAVAFVGRPGSGKSALAAAFWQRGQRVVSDDLCVVSVDEDRPAVVQSGVPRLHLWAETLTALSLDHTGLQRVRPQLEKFALPVGSEQPTAPMPIRRIFAFVDSRAEFGCEVATGSGKLLPLTKSGYCLRFLKGMGCGSQHFLQCVALAQQVEVLRIWGVKKLGSIGDLMGELEPRLLG